MMQDKSPLSTIKLLAKKVFKRNKLQLKDSDSGAHACPKGTSQVGQRRISQRLWSAQDWRAFYEERAGILEYDGQLPRVEAERVAYSTTLAMWMDVNRPPSADMNDCAWCHRGIPQAVLIACLAGPDGHYAVHDSCLPKLLESLRERGIGALTAFGIEPSAEPAPGEQYPTPKRPRVGSCSHDNRLSE
jgi:hypothetical protein